MWLFDPSSPCMATFTINLRKILQIHFQDAVGNLIPLSRNLPHGRFAFGFHRPMAEIIAGHVSGENRMLWTITVILLVLWLLGIVGVYTVGSWIHILLVLAIISIIFNLMSGRRAV
jgi:hypothetical protein